jgi:SHS2 domain-containing protein
MKASHALEEHTGEVRLRLQAPTLAGLFEEAGRSLAELLTEKPPKAGAPTERVAIQAADPEALLVEWINELIYRTETTGRVFGAFRLDRVTDRSLEGAIGGREPGSWRTAVKAATFHGLHIDEKPEGFSASVVLDV